jgi:hypothetical protein
MTDKFALEQCLLNLESALLNASPALQQQSLSLECDGNDKRLNPRFKEEYAGLLYLFSSIVGCIFIRPLL